MSSSIKVLAILGVLAAIVLAAIWLGSPRPSSTLPQPIPAEAKAPPPRTNLSPVFTRALRPRTGTTNPPAVTVAGTASQTNVLTDWEDKLGEILVDDTEVEDKARKMLDMFPRLPEAGQVEAAQHISNLLPDEDYEKFGAYLVNPKTSSDVQDIILGDVLNRPNTIKLPLLLETARDPANAKAGEAKEFLELYLEEDYGTDWEKWEQEMKRWLEENPD